MCADKGLPAIVLKVALHEEIEQVGSITAYGAQFGIAALQDLIAQTGTHIRPSIKKCTGKLRKKEKDMESRMSLNNKQCAHRLYTHVGHLIHYVISVLKSIDVNGYQQLCGQQHSTKYFLLCLTVERNLYKFGIT